MGNLNSPENGMNIEILRYQEIEKKLNKLEQKSQERVALSLLNSYQPEKYPVDLAIDRKNNQYYIISGNEVLKIRLDYKNLESYLKQIKTLLDTNNELMLKGQFSFRTIYEDNIGPWNKKLIEHKDKGIGQLERKKEIEGMNNLVEEMYRFAKNVKGEKIDSINTDDSALRSGVLGTPDTSEIQEIKRKMDNNTSIRYEEYNMPNNPPLYRKINKNATIKT
nr:hypothetical protein [Candidatus Gracilibacteria bacterium]